jgi:hypothetical protein
VRIEGSLERQAGEFRESLPEQGRERRRVVVILALLVPGERGSASSRLRSFGSTRRFTSRDATSEPLVKPPFTSHEHNLLAFPSQFLIFTVWNAKSEDQDLNFSY